MMHKIVVSDIFGRTPALDKLCKAVGSDVDVIDPYDGKFMGFCTEDQAYDSFMTNVGISTYSDLLLSRLEKARTPISLVGFSVGASAIWQISESLNAGKVKRVVCFYGSQVRRLTEIRPSVVIEHVLPMHEPGFSVEELARRLSGIDNIVLYKTPYLHGFMNELSKNYSNLGYSEYVDWLLEKPVNKSAL
jgi:dienelactone hydrolase